MMKKQKLNHNRTYLEKRYEEKYNVSKLCFLIAKAEQLQIKPIGNSTLIQTVQNLKDILNDLVITKENFPYGSLEVKYYRDDSNQNIGRVYPNKLGYCNLTKALRHTLCDDLYFDIDIVNCHPTIYYFLAQKYNIEVAYKLDLSYLKKYVLNRKEILKEAAELNNTSEDIIKEWFIMVYSGADAVNIGLQMSVIMEQTYMNFSIFKGLLHNLVKNEERYKDIKETDTHKML
jgi:hypothetical protein